MLIRFLFLLSLYLIHPSFANNQDIVQPGSNFQTTEEILAMAHAEHPTTCASEIFSNALYEHMDEVSEYDDEARVRLWAKNIMQSPDVLKKVLECDEIRSITDDTQIIHFTPIIFNFSEKDDTRTLTINYSTAKKVLKQKILLSGKRSLPNGDTNPNIMDENDPAIYINTDPAWYAIMVVQHNSLSNFVGPDKNNTLSMKYINDNIDSLYPHGYYCTSKSAIANDNDTINKVVREVIDLEDDSNDYYVAGDVNLEWIMYAEIAAEVIITVVTYGAGEGALLGLKSARSAKSAKNLSKTLKSLEKMDDVKDYVKKAHEISKHADDIADLEKNIANAEKYKKALQRAEKARKAGKDASKYAKEADDILDAAKKINPNMTDDILKNIDNLKDIQKNLTQEMKTAEEAAETMVKNSKNVKQYKESAETFTELMKYRRELRAIRRPQTGNILVRNLKKIKTFKAANTGSKLMNKAGRLGRAGMSSRSAKMGDFLFDATLKHGARLGRVVRDTGLLYGAVTFLGDMYDQTSDSTNEFTNGIEFKPLCLLSADDLEGQDNVVNYGMWLLWEGNSIDPADDDAAYLQAMDFASKFFYQLDEYQDEHGANCNVDIYVVRPIIRIDETNPNKPTGELFYLFMNEVPWTTAPQFNDNVKDIDKWENEQKSLINSDPVGKYKKSDSPESEETTNINEINENE